MLATLLPATAARAAPPPNLPQNARGYETTFSPAFDHDTDGCHRTPAIGPDGTLNPGLKTSGALNGSCRDMSDLDSPQTYAAPRSPTLASGRPGGGTSKQIRFAVASGGRHPTCAPAA